MELEGNIYFLNLTRRAMAFSKLLRRLHRDERGAVSLETVLIIGAIALPILIFLLKYGWPKIKNYFNKGMQNLETESDRVQQGG